MSAGQGDDKLIEAYRAGDQQAADLLFERYYGRLIALVRKQMGWRLHQKEPSSDVALSVMFSVFRRVTDRQVRIPEDGTLWPLLASIALNKIRNKAKFWDRERREQRREVTIDELKVIESGPSPDEVAAVEELVKDLLAQFSERRRAVLSLMLQDYGVSEIARELNISERTVLNTRRAAADALKRTLEPGSTL